MTKKIIITGVLTSLFALPVAPVSANDQPAQAGVGTIVVRVIKKLIKPKVVNAPGPGDRIYTPDGKPAGKAGEGKPGKGK